MSTYVAVFAMMLAYVAVVAAYLALRTLAKLRHENALTRTGSRAAATVPPATRATPSQPPAQSQAQGQGQAQVVIPQALVDATNRNAQLSGSLAAQLEQLRAHVDATAADTLARLADVAEQRDSSGALRHIALVRYDAFGEMSGRMSFSLALLNDKGDGVTISAIAGRSDTSVYAKGVTGGQGEHDLSPEEQQAVSTALHRPRSGLLGRRAS